MKAMTGSLGLLLLGLLLLGLLLLGLSVSSLELTGPYKNVARLRSDARVPCLFTLDKPPVDLNHLTIFWQFLDKEILSYDKTVRTTSPRYSLSTEDLGTGVADLSISNIQIPDGGRYKCSVIYNSERREKDLWLDVGAPPQVTITDKTVVVNTESVLCCSATGFFPIDIEVKWFRGSERLSDVTEHTPQRNPDKTYSVNSTVTITPTEEDREKNFSCRVRHFHLTDPLQVDFQLVYQDVSAERSSARSIAAYSVLVVILIIIIIIAAVLWWRRKLRRKGYTRTPVLEEIQVPRLLRGSPAVLLCDISEYFPDAVTVTWMRRDGDKSHEETDDNQRITSRRATDNTYSRTAGLTITPDLWTHQGAEYICRVEHPSLETPIERSTGRLQVYAKPEISHPIKRNLQNSERMKYSLNLEKFYPKSIKINWTCGERGTEEVLQFTELVTKNPDRTYVISSEVIIPEDRHKDPRFRVRVTWEHESMEEEESRELSIRDSDYRWTPVVGEIQVPRLLLGSPAVLQCDISGYFPDAVTVTWMRRDGDKLHEETDDNQRITSRRAADNTYSRTASLTITPDLRTHQGAEYICLVEHPCLETPIEKSTGRLQVYGKPQMSAPIEITMADSSRVQFSLNLQKFFPKDINISWHLEDANRKYVLSAEETISTRDNEVTYEVSSVVRVPDHTFRDPEKKITVVWKHESMRTPETRSLSVRDLPWRPHVGSINVPRLEDGKAATLTCDISGYFPNLLSVTWFTKREGNVTALSRESSKKDGNVTVLPREPSNVDRIYKMSEKEKRQEDNSYSCEASVTFTPIISSDEGSEILCRVQHPREERPIERSTGPLHIVERSQNSDQSAIQKSGGFGNWMKETFTLNKNIETATAASEDDGAEPQEEPNILTNETGAMKAANVSPLLPPTDTRAI